MSCAACENINHNISSKDNNSGLSCLNGCNKLTAVDWLYDVEKLGNSELNDCVEVQFKESRKDYFRYNKNLKLHIGDIVVVEVSPGYDVGTVTLTGELVRVQIQRKKSVKVKDDLKSIYRIANDEDKTKLQQARNLEKETMFQARTFALKHDLTMKISDVEYQADKTKAIFYYTAEKRVDFRELIKTMAGAFKIRIEMRQIGARQEAGRLGGVGSCGRELCCATWLSDFCSVSTGTARYQQLSLNPQKLAGQCGKLKCCLNYELDSYLDALNHFPSTSIKLKTKIGIASHFKSDIFKQIMWYSEAGKDGRNIIPLTVDNVNEIIEMNKKGIIPQSLKDFMFHDIVEEKINYSNVVGQDSLTRFDERGKKKFKKKHGKKKYFNKKNKHPVN